tara:strand:+ start:6162 stop:6443 length:282 start_codon:yes stop_codon:yes gene_type:complete
VKIQKIRHRPLAPSVNDITKRSARGHGKTDPLKKRTGTPSPDKQHSHYHQADQRQKFWRIGEEITKQTEAHARVETKPKVKEGRYLNPPRCIH